MDKIYLDNITESCIIGTLPEERVSPQTVVVSLRLATDLRQAGLSDRLEDTVDYASVVQTVRDYVSSSSFYLLERLAQGIADAVLCPRIRGVVVTVFKPEALAGAEARIEITRGEYE